MSQIVPRTDREALLEASRGAEVFTHCYANNHIRYFDPFGCIPQNEVDRVLSYFLEKIPQNLWSEALEALGVSLPENSSFARLLGGRVRLKDLDNLEKNQIVDAISEHFVIPTKACSRFKHIADQHDLGFYFQYSEIRLHQLFYLHFLASGCSPESLSLLEMTCEDLSVLSFGDAPYDYDGALVLLEVMTDFRSYLRLASDIIRSKGNSVGRMRGSMIDAKTKARIYFQLEVRAENEIEPKVVLVLIEISVLDPAFWDSCERQPGVWQTPIGAIYGSRKRRLRMMRSLVDALINAKVHQLVVKETGDVVITFNLKGRTTRDVMREMRGRLWSESLETQVES